MAPPLPVNGVVRTRFEGTFSGVSAGWRWFFGIGSAYPFSSTDLSLFAEECFTQIAPAVTGYFTNRWTLSQVVAEDLSTGATGVGLSSHAPVAGADSGNPVGDQTCILLQLPIASRYRGGHPRTYLPPASSTTMLDGHTWKTALTVPLQAAIVTAVSNIVTSSIAGTLGLTNHVAVRYKSGGIPLTPPQVYTVAAYGVEDIVATQRRRTGR